MKDVNPIPASARPIEGEVMEAAPQPETETAQPDERATDDDEPDREQPEARADTGEPVDQTTGEIVEAAAEIPHARRIPPMERAANGDVMHPIAVTGGNMLDLLEDGGLSDEFYENLKRLGEQMDDVHMATGKVAKGKITLTIDLEKDGEAFGIRGKVAVKKPELPRPKSVMWQNEAGEFTRFPPNQAQMFGTRTGSVRNV